MKLNNETAWILKNRKSVENRGSRSLKSRELIEYSSNTRRYAWFRGSSEYTPISAEASVHPPTDGAGTRVDT